MTAATGVMSTLAGTTEGFSGDGGSAAAAQLRLPFGIAVDQTGNLFVGDVGNHVVQRVAAQAIPLSGDLDGDGVADLVQWTRDSGNWTWLNSSDQHAYRAANAKQWGSESAGDVPMLGDIDGDGKADLVVWRASTGTFFWLLSSRGYAYAAAGSKQWGNASLGDVPLLADMDGDGRSDLIVWRPGTGAWYWLTASRNYEYAFGDSRQWGNAAAGDRPLTGDLDGDGAADLVVWRASTGSWFYLTSSSGWDARAARGQQWGNESLGDRPLLGDLDGDGRADLVVWRASSGTWHWLTSSSFYDPAAAAATQWGNDAAGDLPLLADVDGDGRADVNVWRVPVATWFSRPSS